MNGEIYSYIFPKLFEKNALDVFITPIFMKKNRPANKLSVICKEENLKEIEEIIFRETTSFGIRRYYIERTELERSFEEKETRYGNLKIKTAYFGEEIIKFSPEYEDCKKIAEKENTSLQKVYLNILFDLNKK